MNCFNLNGFAFNLTLYRSEIYFHLKCNLAYFTVLQNVYMESVVELLNLRRMCYLELSVIYLELHWT